MADQPPPANPTTRGAQLQKTTVRNDDPLRKGRDAPRSGAAGEVVGDGVGGGPVECVAGAVGWLTIGLGLSLSMPLGAARHFYPDACWAATAIVVLALPWALIRTALTVAALRRRATA
jgi:hypothetical protein